MFARAVFAATLCFAAPCLAQTQITPEAFLDQAVGKTLTFSGYKTGELVGTEQFLSRDKTVWARTDRHCTYGQIDVRGPLICFIYEDHPDPDNCWMPFIDGEGLTVISRNFDIQRITAITEKPVICEDAPLS